METGVFQMWTVTQLAAVSQKLLYSLEEEELEKGEEVLENWFKPGPGPLHISINIYL